MSVTDNVLAKCIIQIGYDAMGQCVCCVYVWAVVSRTERREIYLRKMIIL